MKHAVLPQWTQQTISSYIMTLTWNLGANKKNYPVKFKCSLQYAQYSIYLPSLLKSNGLKMCFQS